MAAGRAWFAPVPSSVKGAGAGELARCGAGWHGDVQGGTGQGRPQELGFLRRDAHLKRCG